jgi:hypothetical protein
MKYLFETIGLSPGDCARTKGITGLAGENIVVPSCHGDRGNSARDSYEKLTSGEHPQRQCHKMERVATRSLSVRGPMAACESRRIGRNREIPQWT